jgi:glycosyltransferase involved in cell wall biosynthesis
LGRRAGKAASLNSLFSLQHNSARISISMSSISVIIPNYNRAELVGETIENMLGQTLPPTEVIVVDDGSTDGSRDVIRSFGDRVKLIAQENRGPGAARNAGFAVAAGEFIQFMDSDDLVSRNKLAVQLAALNSSKADFAYCPWVRTLIRGREMKFSGPVMQGGPVPAWKPMLEWQMGSWCLVFQNCLFRRAILEKAGRYRIDLMPTEDSEYLVRILLAGARAVYTGDCLVFYREHLQNQITSAGTSAQRRAADWTNYWRVVGEQVAAKLNSFHPSTVMEMALIIRRHNQYCRRHGWPELDAGNPLMRMMANVSALRLDCADYWEKITRRFFRLTTETPSSKGMMLRPPGAQDFRLANELGYDVN